jgi:hypothetical protein
MLRSTVYVIRLWAVCTLLAAASAAPAAALEGVTLPSSLRVGSADLTLNGTAVREKFLFKIYVGGLYLPKPSNNAEDIIRQDTAKALVMQFLRSVKAERLRQAYSEGFSANDPALATRRQADVHRFLDFLRDVREGDRMSYTYDPIQGSKLSYPDGRTLVVTGKDFADLFLSVYIGPNPPTAAVKRGLLGL